MDRMSKVSKTIVYYYTHEYYKKTQKCLTELNAIFFLDNKGRSPYNGRLSDFSFYIDSQISVHRKFKK
jgi:hypothetical protein